MLFFLREAGAQAVLGLGGTFSCSRSYSVGYGYVVLFMKNWSIHGVLNAACWKSDLVFAYFYCKDDQHVFDSCRSLSPAVATGSLIV